jgi:hypothetical protein
MLKIYLCPSDFSRNYEVYLQHHDRWITSSHEGDALIKKYRQAKDQIECKAMPTVHFVKNYHEKYNPDAPLPSPYRRLNPQNTDIFSLVDQYRNKIDMTRLSPGWTIDCAFQLGIFPDIQEEGFPSRFTFENFSKAFSTGVAITKAIFKGAGEFKPEFSLTLKLAEPYLEWAKRILTLKKTTDYNAKEMPIHTPEEHQLAYRIIGGLIDTSAILYLHYTMKETVQAIGRYLGPSLATLEMSAAMVNGIYCIGALTAAYVIYKGNMELSKFWYEGSTISLEKIPHFFPTRPELDPLSEHLFYGNFSIPAPHKAVKRALIAFFEKGGYCDVLKEGIETLGAFCRALGDALLAELAKLFYSMTTTGTPEVFGFHPVFRNHTVYRPYHDLLLLHGSQHRGLFYYEPTAVDDSERVLLLQPSRKEEPLSTPPDETSYRVSMPKPPRPFTERYWLSQPCPDSFDIQRTYTPPQVEGKKVVFRDEFATDRTVEHRVLATTPLIPRPKSHQFHDGRINLDSPRMYEWNTLTPFYQESVPLLHQESLPPLYQEGDALEEKYPGRNTKTGQEYTEQFTQRPDFDRKMEYPAVVIPHPTPPTPGHFHDATMKPVESARGHALSSSIFSDQAPCTEISPNLYAQWQGKRLTSGYSETLNQEIHVFDKTYNVTDQGTGRQHTEKFQYVYDTHGNLLMSFHSAPQDSPLIQESKKESRKIQMEILLHEAINAPREALHSSILELPQAPDPKSPESSSSTFRPESVELPEAQSSWKPINVSFEGEIGISFSVHHVPGKKALEELFELHASGGESLPAVENYARKTQTTKQNIETLLFAKSETTTSDNDLRLFDRLRNEYRSTLKDIKTAQEKLDHSKKGAVMFVDNANTSYHWLSLGAGKIAEGLMGKVKEEQSATVELKLKKYYLECALLNMCRSLTTDPAEHATNIQRSLLDANQTLTHQYEDSIRTQQKLTNAISSAENPVINFYGTESRRTLATRSNIHQQTAAFLATSFFPQLNDIERFGPYYQKLLPVFSGEPFEEVFGERTCVLMFIDQNPAGRIALSLQGELLKQCTLDIKNGHETYWNFMNLKETWGRERIGIVLTLHSALMDNRRIDPGLRYFLLDQLLQTLEKLPQTEGRFSGEIKVMRNLIPIVQEEMKRIAEGEKELFKKSRFAASQTQKLLDKLASEEVLPGLFDTEKESTPVSLLEDNSPSETEEKTSTEPSTTPTPTQPQSLKKVDRCPPNAFLIMGSVAVGLSAVGILAACANTPVFHGKAPITLPPARLKISGTEVPFFHALTDAPPPNRQRKTASLRALQSFTL